MTDGFVIRFIRRDGRPPEEYSYHTYSEAWDHLSLFGDDDSGLYKRIELIRIGNCTAYETVLFSLFPMKNKTKKSNVM